MEEKYSQWLREFDEMSVRQLKQVDKAIALWHQHLISYKEYFISTWTEEKYKRVEEDIFNAEAFIRRLLERVDKPEDIKRKIQQFVRDCYNPHEEIQMHVEYGYNLRNDEVKNLKDELCNAQKHIEMFKDLYESEKEKSNGKQTKKLTSPKSIK